MTKPNNISAMRTQGQDLSNRWTKLLGEIREKTGFEPSNEADYQTSTWWRTGKIGAVILSGQIKHNHEHVPAVLKIQGTKPNISEAEQIHQFQSQNESQVIRAPHIYAHTTWNEDQQYEAIVFEQITGRKIIDSRPAKADELAHFFELYSEYKDKCINQPWLDKPIEYSFHKQLSDWQEAVKQQAENDQFDLSTDQSLIDQVIDILDEKLSADQMTFQHGHLATKDFVENENGEVIILSNLFWGWRHPSYDTVFAYHWHMLGMEHVKILNPGILLAERDKWLKFIYNTSVLSSTNIGEEIKPEKIRSQIDVALLERTLAAVLIDRHMLAADPGNKYLIKNQPLIVEFLIGELKRLMALMG